MPALGHKHTEVIPWGVDADRFRPADDRAALRGILGWAEDEIVVFTARRLVPRMGVGQLVRGFGLAAGQCEGLRLVVAGDGPLRGRLEALARRAGGTIDFAGFVPDDDLVRYFQAADLFVLPSVDLEAFGLVTVEALACGTPVLGTQRCATPEILGGLDSRLLIPRDDAQAMAEAILGPGIEIAQDREFAARCRGHVLERYTWDRVGAAFERLICHLLDERGKP
jgi:glycosyltransferase involved in cell wall biosynthesis